MEIGRARDNSSPLYSRHLQPGDAPRPGIEPGTFRSSVWRSPNWATTASLPRLPYSEENCANSSNVNANSSSWSYFDVSLPWQEPIYKVYPLARLIVQSGALNSLQSFCNKRSMHLVTPEKLPYIKSDGLCGCSDRGCGLIYTSLSCGQYGARTRDIRVISTTL